MKNEENHYIRSFIPELDGTATASIYFLIEFKQTLFSDLYHFLFAFVDPSISDRQF